MIYGYAMAREAELMADNARLVWGIFK